jgi:hypothetical protein
VTSLHVNESFIVACLRTHAGDDREFETSAAGPQPAMRILVACFDETLQIANSESTGWWDPTTDTPLAEQTGGQTWRLRGSKLQHIEGSYVNSQS